MIFNSAEACRIVSADVDIEVNNTVTFELRDANSNILDDTTYTLSQGPQTFSIVRPESLSTLARSTSRFSKSTSSKGYVIFTEDVLRPELTFCGRRSKRKMTGEAYDAIRREDFRIAHFGVG